MPYTPRSAIIFCYIHSTTSHFWLWSHLCSKSNIPACMLHTHRKPKFSSILLCGDPLLSYELIFRKAHRMIPNNLEMFKAKNTHMHAGYTHEAHMFVHFALQWALFELGLNFGISAPNKNHDLDMLRGKKYHRSCYILVQTLAEIFVRFILWCELFFEETELFEIPRFRVISYFWEKCTE